MSLASTATTRAQVRRLGTLEAAGLVMQRNYVVYRDAWWVFVSGFLEPVFYLFSIGVGVGKLVPGFDVGGTVVPYAEFVAPGMVAASAMNGALLDATYNFFFKLKYVKTFDQMLATPLTTRDIARGELAWSLLRGGTYSLAFLLLMVALGLVHSWWAVLVPPAALLIGLAFGAVGMAVSTFLTSWQHFEYVTLFTMPLFLFSATFFPVEAFPATLRAVVEWTPLYRGVVMVRELTTGTVGFDSLFSVAYLLVFGAVGLAVVGRRLDRLLLR